MRLCKQAFPVHRSSWPTLVNPYPSRPSVARLDDVKRISILSRSAVYLFGSLTLPEAMTVDAISLEVFKNLFSSVAEEMGVTLQRAAFSPNIRERLDFSCALFDASGQLIAQAAHIPVHLGSMPASVMHVLK